jgi:hypothetical protein
MVSAHIKYDPQIERTEERAQLNAEIAAAINEAGSGHTGLFVPLDRASNYFGDELLFEISPSNLVWQVRFFIATKRTERVCDYFLAAGAFKDHLFEISKNPVFREVADMVEVGANRGMKSRKRLLGRLARGEPVIRNSVCFDSPEKIDAYLAHVEELVESIRLRGIVRRAAMVPAEITDIRTSIVRPLAGEIMEQDVGVGLLANGKLIRVCAGTHRTAAARLLGVQSMPVELRLIHVKFLARIMKQHDCDAIEAVHHCVRRAANEYSEPRDKSIKGEA